MGLRVTLLTVAIAMLGFNAMAMAPTIGEIPDIIVGDGEEATDSNRFVAPDFIDLDSWVTDDTTSPGAIIWSYGVAVTPTRYTLDGVAPLDVGTEDPNVPGSKRIDTQDSDPAEADSDARTVTIRDELRSPVATDPGPYADPGQVGILPDSRVITLYASDGTSWSIEESMEHGTIIIYTDNDGLDRFSPAEPPPIYEADFTAGTWDWTFAENIPAGSATGTQNASSGLCIDVPASDPPENDGVWFSAYGVVDLVDNAVYRARMTMSTTQTTVFNTPLWMMVYDNIGNDAGGTPHGQNDFGGETFVLDNEGGANSPIVPPGRSTFDFYFAPTPFRVAHFRDTTNGFLSAALDADNDIRLQFRIIDSNGANINAQEDEGAVCMSRIGITRFDFDDRTEGTQVYNVDSSTPFVDADSNPDQAGSYQLDQIADAATFAISGGVITISPTSGNWNLAVHLLRAGDRTVNLGTTTGDENRDNWPIPWAADTLYMIEYDLSAPSATDEENPPDVIRIGADVLDQQIVTDNFIAVNTPDFSTGSLNTRGLTMPRTGTPQTYTCFWYSLSESLTNIPDALRWRPRFEILCSPDLNPIGRTNNTGGVSVHGVTVTEISF
jgi:hypothetical protein